MKGAYLILFRRARIVLFFPDPVRQGGLRRFSIRWSETHPPWGRRTGSFARVATPQRERTSRASPWLAGRGVIRARHHLSDRAFGLVDSRLPRRRAETPQGPVHTSAGASAMRAKWMKAVNMTSSLSKREKILRKPLSLRKRRPISLRRGALRPP